MQNKARQHNAQYLKEREAEKHAAEKDNATRRKARQKMDRCFSVLRILRSRAFALRCFDLRCAALLRCAVSAVALLRLPVASSCVAGASGPAPLPAPVRAGSAACARCACARLGQRCGGASLH